MVRISRRVVMVVSMSPGMGAHNRALDPSSSPTNVARLDDTFWRASGATFGRCARRSIARPALRGNLLDNRGRPSGPGASNIVWYGGLRVLRLETSIGTLIAYQTLILQLINPISQMIDSFQNLQQNLVRTRLRRRRVGAARRHARLPHRSPD